MKSLVFVVPVMMFSVLNAQKNITTKPTVPVPAQNVKNYIGADGLAAWVKSWLGVLSQEIYTARIKDENLTAEVEGLQRSNAILVAEMQQVQRSFNKTLKGVEQKVKNSLLTDASIQAENVALTNQVATLKQQLQQLKDSSQKERTLLTNKIQSLEQQQHMLVQQTSNAFDQLLAGPIRLVNGSHSREGRIEVFYNGQWGTVCDDSFGVNDARVACRQLGYPSAYPTVYERARFGQGTGPIWLDGLDCVGSELDIRLCKHNGWGKHNCGHHEDVGVSCE